MERVLFGCQWSVSLSDFILEGFVETVRREQSLQEASRRELGRNLLPLPSLVLQNPLDNGILSRCIRPLSDEALERFAIAISQILERNEKRRCPGGWA